MAIAGVVRPGPTLIGEPPRHRRPRRWLVVAGLLALAGVLAGIWFAGQNWPFRYSKMQPLLEDDFGSRVTIAHYRCMYFPNPGFVATGLTIRRRSATDQPPIGTVERMLVESSWIDVLLLRQRAERVEMTGVHMVLPPPGSRAAQADFPPGSTLDFTGPDTPIARLEIHDSLLDVLRTNGTRFSFPVHQLQIENLRKGKAFAYAVDMEDAIPRGRIRASGSFGPLSAGSSGDTPVSGRFTFENIRLDDIGKLHGTMQSSGRFEGGLAEIRAQAETETPDFAVDDGRPIGVAGTIDCTVNGLNGNVIYHSMEARAGATRVLASGSTSGKPGKATDLDLTIRNGRVQDVLRPFLHGEVPITGPVILFAHAHLEPQGEGGFLERLRVDGTFQAPRERETDERLERSLTDFSQRAQGKKAPKPDNDGASGMTDAVSSISGSASIRKGVVTAHGLTFTVAGAQARLEGTFNLHTCEAHLAGKMATRSDISHEATGFKSFLLKPLVPFFRTKKAGAVIPIAVTGRPGKYQVTENIGAK